MRIGIIGGGQLGRMLALAAYPLGARVTFLDPAPDAPMSFVAKQICGNYAELTPLEQLARDADVVTYEFENVPVASAEHIAQFTKIFPPPGALRVSQDRWDEKTFFQSLGIPTPKFVRVDSLADLENGLAQLGTPAILKTRRMGYDGKGQLRIESYTQAREIWAELDSGGLILEECVPFTRELSILAVRGQDGGTAFYPLVENHHRDGILRYSIAPAPQVTPALQNLAEGYAEMVLSALEYVGVLAIEVFQHGDELLANEMAPRVHNSGHWTIEGAVASQFENHARAIMGLPLGETSVRGASAMINFIGIVPDLGMLWRMPDTHVHLYDKAPRPGRKLGHMTIVAKDQTIRNDRLNEVLRNI